MTYLINKRANSNRDDIFKLSGYEHTRNSDQMHLFGFQDIVTVSNECVHDMNSKKKCFSFRLVNRKDFDHPVNHFRADFSVDSVLI